MLPKMFDLPRVKKELTAYQESINLIENKHVKQKAQSLLDSLKDELYMIDRGHASEFDGNIQPKNIRENVVNSIEIRRELQKYTKLR